MPNIEARIAELEEQIATLASMFADVSEMLDSRISALENHTHTTSPGGFTGEPIKEKYGA